MSGEIGSKAEAQARLGPVPAPIGARGFGGLGIRRRPALQRIAEVRGPAGEPAARRVVSPDAVVGGCRRDRGGLRGGHAAFPAAAGADVAEHRRPAAVC